MISFHSNTALRKAVQLISGRKSLSVMQLISLVGVSFIFTFAAPSPAKAELRMCNDTKNLVGIALGFRDEEKWITEGWWQLPADSCSTLIEGNLNNRFYYIYAEDADYGGQWRGDVFMCTDDQEFRVEGNQECFTRGFQKTGFFEIDTTDKTSWMVRLNEQAPTGSPN